MIIRDRGDYQMILERDGKYFKKVEREEEISEIEYLKLKIAELEERLNSIPSTTIIYQGCPWPCPNTFPSTGSGPVKLPYEITCYF